MSLKVTWKKGMRLSTDVFDAMDVCNLENLRMANLIATGGRFGLVQGYKPFELTVNVSNNVLEVVSLTCYGVTKSGRIVDIDFDSNFANTFDTRVAIPFNENDESLILVVRLYDKQWREFNDMLSETVYAFELISENTPIDNDSLPIGRIVNQYGLRLDEIDFVPPCLYVNAHSKYIESLNSARLVLKSIADQCLVAQNCVARHLLALIWPAAVNIYNDLDKGRDSLTPNALFNNLQKVVAAFVIGCTLDEYVTLENVEPFVEYYNIHYNGRSVFNDIRKGVELCSEISIKINAVCSMTEIIEVPLNTVEQPKHKSAPQPKSPGRKGWEGIEI